MAFTLKLDVFNHDLKIKNGKFVRVQGADEVRQRIKVALWHHFDEYFLNRPNGLPWYQSILGSKMPQETLQTILRQKIQSVPGVIQVLSLQISRIGRDYTASVTALVERGPADGQSMISIDGILLGGE